MNTRASSRWRVGVGSSSNRATNADRLQRLGVLTGLCLCTVLSGCRTYGSSNRKASLLRQSVVVELDDNAVTAVFPDDQPLGERESLRRQTYSISEEGEFTFTRTVEKDVGFIGFEVRTLDVQEANAQKIAPFSGVAVRSVKKHGPAWVAGLRAGDVVSRVGDQDVRSPHQFEYLTRDVAAPGDTVSLDVLRGGESFTLDVQLAGDREIIGSRTYRRRLPILDDRNRSGMTLMDYGDDLYALLFPDRPTPAGLQIVEVLPGGPMFFSDLRLGDFVTKVENEPVLEIADFERALEGFKPGDKVEVTARSGGRTLTTTLRLDDHARRKRGFSIFGLVSYREKPYWHRFALVGGLLLSKLGTHEVNGNEHVSENRWSMLFGLLSYHGSAERKTLRLAWILPITFGG